MKYIEYDQSKIRWNGESVVNKTFLIAPLGPKSPIMIFNPSGKLLLKQETEGFPSHFVQLEDLSGYSYFSGNGYVGPLRSQKYCANGRYTIGKLYITDNKLNTKKVIDYIPTPKIPKAIGLHMHGNYVLGENHYLLQAISFEEVEIVGKKSYVVNCILQEQLDGKVVWEWQSIDEPELYEASFTRNKYFCDEVANKEYACDYAHMNSAIKTNNGKYIYISFKHIGIVKLDYHSKKLIWILGKKTKNSFGFPQNAVIFGHQHDLHLIDDNTMYFWDNEHLSYIEMKIINDKVTHYKTFCCPTKCEWSVMGNAIKASTNIVDICYGMRSPSRADIYLQPIISEFDIDTGKKLLDITIFDQSPEFVNIMYQVNRGINIYEN